MAQTPADHLRDALEAIAAVEEYTKNGKADFDRNAMVRDAVCARLIHIGQAVKDAQAEGMDLPSMERAIPWRAVAGMSDRLAHKYALLDKTLVWTVVERDLPRLRQAIVRLLGLR